MKKFAILREVLIPQVPTKYACIITHLIVLDKNKFIKMIAFYLLRVELFNLLLYTITSSQVARNSLKNTHLSNLIVPCNKFLAAWLLVWHHLRDVMHRVSKEYKLFFSVCVCVWVPICERICERPRVYLPTFWAYVYTCEARKLRLTTGQFSVYFLFEQSSEDVIEITCFHNAAVVLDDALTKTNLQMAIDDSQPTAATCFWSVSVT